MSLKINPSTVKLGVNATGEHDNRYVANYIPVDPATLPVSCGLPSLQDYTPESSDLVPLDQACLFQFPDVIALPPVLVPDIPPSIAACSILNVESAVTYSGTAKDSSLTFTATGPSDENGDGIGECSFKLIGTIDAKGCEAINVDSRFTFSENASNSSVQAITNGCNIELLGDINIDACQQMEGKVNINFPDAMQGSSISLTTDPENKCNFSLDGDIVFTGCETFDAKAYINVTGPLVKKSTWTTESSGPSDCGAIIRGDVVIDGCASFDVKGGFNIKGTAVKANTLSVTASGPAKCGILLGGDLEIDACNTFDAKTNFKVTGAGVTTVKPVTITSTGTPNCGFALDGEININACSNVNVSVLSGTGSIRLVDGSNNKIHSSPLVISASTATYGCDVVMKLNVPDIALALPRYGYTPPATPTSPDSITTKKGCIWDSSTDGIGIEIETYLYERTGSPYVAEDRERYRLTGSLPVPCFGCNVDASKDYAFKDIALASLSVSYIEPSTCCDKENTAHYIDMCAGKLSFYTKTDNSWLEATSANIYMGDEYSNYGSITPNYFDITQKRDGADYFSSTWTSRGIIFKDKETNYEIKLSTYSGTIEAYTSVSISSGTTTTLGTESVSSRNRGTNDSATLNPYGVYVGDASGNQSTLASDSLTITDGKKNIYLGLDNIGTKSAYFQQIDICVNGVTKKAYVLMTTPE